MIDSGIILKLSQVRIGHVQSPHALLIALIFCATTALTQYAPPAGQPGTTAIHKDSSAIVGWANSVAEFKRGASDIANGWSLLASFGDSTEALGYAQGNSTDVVSLGDSGYVTLAFPFPIMNGIGNDFAVFENSFSNDYLEFAHVEVSSDGIYFVRLPSISLISVVAQTGPYSYSVTEQIHNLAGKYRQGYGTPFDLEDIADSAGINLDSVLFVRIIDVIGTIDPAFGTYDGAGNIINDPYPTDFESGGFDLDAVAVINENNIYAPVDEENEFTFSIFPNPSNGIFTIQTNLMEFSVQIFDVSGSLIWFQENNSTTKLQVDLNASAGLYLVVVSDENIKSQQLIVVQ